MSFDASDRASLGERLSRSDVVMSLKLKLISVFFFFFFFFFFVQSRGFKNEKKLLTNWQNLFTVCSRGIAFFCLVRRAYMRRMNPRPISKGSVRDRRQGNGPFSRRPGVSAIAIAFCSWFFLLIWTFLASWLTLISLSSTFKMPATNGLGES